MSRKRILPEPLLKRLVCEATLPLVLWLFRPPGLFHALWYCFWYAEWPREEDYVALGSLLVEMQRATGGGKRNH